MVSEVQIRKLQTHFQSLAAGQSDQPNVEKRGERQQQQQGGGQHEEPDYSIGEFDPARLRNQILQ